MKQIKFFLMIAALAGLISGGLIFATDINDPTFYGTMSVGTWTNVQSFIGMVTNTGSTYTNGWTNTYRMSGTNLLGRISYTTNTSLGINGTTNEDAYYFEWRRSERIRHYILERSSDGGSTFTNYVAIAPNVTNWTDSGIEVWAAGNISNYSLVPNSTFSGLVTADQTNEIMGSDGTLYRITNYSTAADEILRFTPAATSAYFVLDITMTNLVGLSNRYDITVSDLDFVSNLLDSVIGDLEVVSNQADINTTNFVPRTGGTFQAPVTNTAAYGTSPVTDTNQFVTLDYLDSAIPLSSTFFMFGSSNAGATLGFEPSTNTFFMLNTVPTGNTYTNEIGITGDNQACIAFISTNVIRRTLTGHTEVHAWLSEDGPGGLDLFPAIYLWDVATSNLTALNTNTNAKTVGSAPANEILWHLALPAFATNTDQRLACIFWSDNVSLTPTLKMYSEGADNSHFSITLPSVPSAAVDLARWSSYDATQIVDFVMQVNTSFIGTASAFAEAATWTNEANAYVEDASTADNGGEFVQAEFKITGFDFNIPASATITGMEVYVRHRYTNTGAEVYGTNVWNLYDADNAVKVSYRLSNRMDHAYTFETNIIGSPTNCFGAVWTPADVNSTNFGIGFVPVDFTFSTSNQVDYMTARVYWTNTQWRAGHTTNGHFEFLYGADRRMSIDPVGGLNAAGNPITNASVVNTDEIEIETGAAGNAVLICTNSKGQATWVSNRYAVVKVASQSTNTANLVVTGVGFRPQSAVVFGILQGLDSTSQGVVDQDGTEFCFKNAYSVLGRGNNASELRDSGAKDCWINHLSWDADGATFVRNHDAFIITNNVEYIIMFYR